MSPFKETKRAPPRHREALSWVNGIGLVVIPNSKPIEIDSNKCYSIVDERFGGFPDQKEGS
jgi:hypothetical protein